MKKKSKPARRAAYIDALQMRKIVTAQRAWHRDLIERFEAKLAEVDAKVRAAEAERAKLIERHAEAPTKIAECDACLIRLAKVTPYEIKDPAIQQAAKATKRLGKVQARLMELAENMTVEEIEALMASLAAK